MDVTLNGAKIYYTIDVLGGINITESMVVSWIVMLIIVVFCKVLTHNLKVRPESKRQLIAEFLLCFVDLSNFFICKCLLFPAAGSQSQQQSGRQPHREYHPEVSQRPL